MNEMAPSTNQRANQLVAYWLLAGVLMTMIQIALGGITRLTGSGLSITEWNLITGTLPPLSKAAWMEAFEKYQQTPQFQILNISFTLEDFQFIFFWEWFHRLWARAIGLVFAVGFLYFFIKGYFKKEMIQPLIYLFLLGALQGAIGWIMVASGLTGDAVYVKPTRLALHFVFALGLLAYCFWFALLLLVKPKEINHFPSIQRKHYLIFFVLLIQLVFGALMAGHKAALSAPTWPTINGDWVPNGLFANPSFFLNFIDNKMLIHFVHRGLAYLLLLILMVYTLHLSKHKGGKIFEKIKWLPLGLLLVQVILGIATLLLSNSIVAGKWGGFEWLAQIHQLVGICFLLAMVFMQFLTRKMS